MKLIYIAKAAKTAVGIPLENQLLFMSGYDLLCRLHKGQILLKKRSFGKTEIINIKEYMRGK